MLKRTVFKGDRGFTLIELAIVMFILGLLLASLLAPLSLSIEQERRESTEYQLEGTKEALIGFAISNGRLPCPDCRDNIGNCNDPAVILNDGLEDRIQDPVDATGFICAAADTATPDGNSAIAQGNLPWVTLGVDRFDPWNNQFSYYVDRDAADTIDNQTPGVGCNAVNSQLASIALCANGPIQINDMSDDCVGVSNAVADQVSVLVISHGANAVNQGNGIIQMPALCNEFENFDTFNTAQPYNLDFVVTDYSDPNGGSVLAFDDMVVWITAGQLKSKLLSAGLLP